MIHIDDVRGKKRVLIESRGNCVNQNKCNLKRTKVIIDFFDV